MFVWILTRNYDVIGVYGDVTLALYAFEDTVKERGDTGANMGVWDVEEPSYKFRELEDEDGGLALYEIKRWDVDM